MNLVQVQQFLCVVKHMNMSKAARELYISQPALSLSISRLEAELGVKLFYRDGNKLTLSAEGEQLTEDFRSLRENYEQIVSKSLEMSQTKANAVTIGFSGSVTLFATFFTTDYFNSFQNITIKKVYAENGTLIDLMKNGLVDFIITSVPIEDPMIAGINILSEEVGIAVSSGHPLAKKKTVSFRELKKYPLHAFVPTHSIRVISDRLCAQNGFIPEYASESEYKEFFQRIEKERGGEGFAAFCMRDSFDSCYGNGFRYLTVDAPRMQRTTMLGWNKERKLEYEYEELIDHIVQSYPDLHRQHLNLNAMLFLS